MTGYEVDFLGCKISHTDAQAIEDALVAAGHRPDTAAGDVRVINACCITAEAEKKTRRRVRQMLRGVGDDGHVFVTGCGAANDADQYRAIDARVTVLPGAASLAAGAIVEAADALAGLGCRGPAPGVAPGHDPNLRTDTRRTRAFVKVQDGCNFDCSYCIVPAVRGEPRSRPVDRIVDEVARRAAAGQREIVLTGVNIGLYRDDATRAGLARLLHEVADVDDVARVRISSIESNHVNRRLVAAMAAHPKVCPHLHVPLQSGDDGVLRNMGRHYDAARYVRSIEDARAELPLLNLTTDVIVGFPGEDDAAFANTLDLVEQLGVTKVHAFPYSARPGTPAATAELHVSKQTKSERSRQLRDAADVRARAHRALLVGTRDEVVIEARGATGGATLTEAHVASADRRAPEYVTGYTRDYSPARLHAGDTAHIANGNIVAVRIESLDEASGVLVARPAPRDIR